MYDSDYETKWTETIKLDIRHAPGAPKITIEEPVCDDEATQDTITLLCTDDGLRANPPVSLFKWRLVNGEERVAPRVQVPSNMVLSNGASDVTCSSVNSIG